jgi:hypothetical protein
MSSEVLVRWSGLALAVGGIGIATFLLTLYPLGDSLSPQVLLIGASVAAHIFHIVGALAALVGLAGLYSRIRDRTGWLGLLAFLVATFGTAFSVAGGLVAAFIFPVIAARAPDALEPQGPLFGPGPAGTAFLFVFLLSMAGYSLLGVALLRSRQFAPAACWLLIAGAILLNLPSSPITPIPSIVPTVGAVLFGAATLWLGWELWTDQAGATRRMAATRVQG